MFKRVIELKLFSRAISSDEKVEKEIEINGKLFSGLMGQGRSSRGIPILIVADAYAKVK